MSPKQAFSLMIEDNTRDMFALVTEQMSAKQGLQIFGKAGAKAVIKELEQLVYRKVMEGRKSHDLNRDRRWLHSNISCSLKRNDAGGSRGKDVLTVVSSGCTSLRRTPAPLQSLLSHCSSHPSLMLLNIDTSSPATFWVPLCKPTWMTHQT